VDWPYVTFSPRRQGRALREIKDAAGITDPGQTIEFAQDMANPDVAEQRTKCSSGAPTSRVSATFHCAAVRHRA